MNRDISLSRKPRHPGVATWHKWLGLLLTVPLLGWVFSSMALIVITMNIPNGLQGIYRLQPYNSVDIRLDKAVLSPTDLLRRLASGHGIERVHWLRLESRGPHLLYVVRPTPFSLAMTFDAMTGKRLDPLSDELLALTANEALIGSRLEALEPALEFNRDYVIDRVPAVAARMIGDQPSVLMLSRDSGRTLRRMDRDAEGFHWWYRNFHVNQYSDHVIPWTALLYVCAAGVILLTVLGYILFWRRRMRDARPRSSGDLPLGARNLHRKMGVVFGGVLVVQLLAGIYIWLSLGPLNDEFRGKPSFARNWSAGVPASAVLADARTVLAAISKHLPEASHPVQAIEWRRFLDRDAWLVTYRQDERPIAFDAASGARIDALGPEIAGEIARQETDGQPAFDYLGPLHFESMDLNKRIPAYRFRFRDPQVTDVYVLQNTGEVIMRRPEFWRIFGPFLGTHMLALTRNKTWDITLLVLLQIGVLAVILTGWRLQFPRNRPIRPAVKEGLAHASGLPRRGALPERGGVEEGA